MARWLASLFANQSRRQDSVTGGGHEKSILCQFERGTGALEIYSSPDQINKVRSKKSKRFSGRIRKFKRFFRPKTDDLQKKRSSLKLQGIFRPKTGDLPKKKAFISKTSQNLVSVHKIHKLGPRFALHKPQAC